MIRRAVDWLLYLLHIKKREEPKSAHEVLIGILPIICACMVIVALVRSLPKEQVALWRRLLRKFRHTFRHWRMVLVGY